ncbi:MAG: alpha-ketoacid dehydrogenase subunit beta [Candidatus Sericytochromatia bacterium]|nr:alpha-ketoacid dehydrogenase subunit beta [Candidatus Tanganyikabacteria bacterium]
MPTLNLLQSIGDALDTAMAADDRIVVMGEDVGAFGGVFRATSGLHQKYGEDRVIDTPLTEAGILGAAIGMALNGLRPVPEIQFADFVYPAFDQIVNELAKYRYRSAGQYPCPVVVRMPFGGGIKGGHYHSQSPEAYFCHTPGLKVVVPSTPEDAKGLLLAALAQDDPVIFMEPKRMYRAARGEVPEGAFQVPIGKAKVVRAGDHATVLSWGAMVHTAIEAADILATEGVTVDLLDLRTLLPLDLEAILASVTKTGRLVIVHEAPRTGGFAGEIAALVAEHALTSMEAPILRVTGYDTPFPYALEHHYLPDAARIAQAVRQTVAF